MSRPVGGIDIVSYELVVAIGRDFSIVVDVRKVVDNTSKLGVNVHPQIELSRPVGGIDIVVYELVVAIGREFSILVDVRELVDNASKLDVDIHN